MIPSRACFQTLLASLLSMEIPLNLLTFDSGLKRGEQEMVLYLVAFKRITPSFSSLSVLECLCGSLNSTKSSNSVLAPFLTLLGDQIFFVYHLLNS
jgi:hypothetical protein